MLFSLASNFLTLLMIKRLLALASVVMVALSPLSWGQSQLEETRQILQELVDSRQAIADEQALWLQRSQTLRDTIELLKLEIELLDKRIADTEAESTQADRDRIQLNGQIEELKDASAVVATVIRDFEQRMLVIVKAMPSHLKEKLETIVGRIPDRNTPPNRIRASLGERMLNIVSLLDQMEVFNNGIHVEAETRKIENQNISVQLLYIGLSRAYYVNKDQGIAGYGSVNIDAGWTWTPDPSLVDAVDKAIRVFKNEIPAEFVTLPSK